ncbi:MAG: aminoglycoside phosphotransferase family protein [Boseongicola sp.]
MTEREQHIVDFLSNAGWAHATIHKMAGDLSARRFLRLARRDGTRAVLMDADPAVDRSTAAFLSMTNWLAACGLSAPKVFDAQVDQGLVLLQDFGDEKLAGLIQLYPERQREYYNLAIDALLIIRDASHPGLIRPSARQMAEATTMVGEWYPHANRTALAQFRIVLESALEELLRTEPTVSLRDFHADNLMWLSDQKGVLRLGFLDYQDAILTHPVYDLMSLLTDARVAVPRALRAEMIEVYAAKTSDSVESISRAVAVLGAQRNLRILGIFARSASRYGKSQHLDSLARVYSYLLECLSHQVFADNCPILSEMIPEPNAKLLSELRT